MRLEHGYIFDLELTNNWFNGFNSCHLNQSHTLILNQIETKEIHNNLQNIVFVNVFSPMVSIVFFYFF